MGLQERKVANPQPFSFAPSLLFEGNDGSWSTFIVRIGTPAQTFRVMISTTGQETWIPLVDGCLPVDPENCGELRGVQPFQNGPSSGFKVNKSSTWELVNLYKLALEDNLVGYTGNGMYGFDTVGLQIQNSDGLALDHQVVAGIATKNFMFGIFALGPKPTNFSDFNDPQPSFMWSLKNQSLIPSLSYGYSAGASYNDSLGSLVLGGYDASYVDATPKVQFNIDLSSSLVVGLQAIQATNTLSGIVSLLPEAVMISIDSTIPEIWLPIPACEIFEKAFVPGLQLDNATGRYLVNETTHSRLKELNPSIIFKLGNTTFGGPTTNIVFPYAAFDLQVDYPIYPNATNYFPIRRGENDTQYVIGRTFLQEAYIVVDYERSNFSISQRVFAANRQQTIIPILSTDYAVPRSGLARSAIIGIVIGVVVLCLILIGGVFFCWRRHKKRNAESVSSDNTEEHQEVDNRLKGPDSTGGVASSREVDDGSTQEETHMSGAIASHEMDATQEMICEAHGRPHAHEMGPALAHEIGGKQLRAELPGTYLKFDDYL